MATKSFSTILAAMKSFIRTKYPKLDTSEGTIANDVVMSAPGQELAQLYEESATVSAAQSIDTADDTGLGRSAGNFALQKIAARTSQGSITFFSNSAPVSDVSIPAGTLVSTVSTTGSPGIQFVTTRSVTMYQVLAAGYLNTATGKYEITTEIQAVVAGVDGNVGPQNISVLSTPISGVNGCYNANATSGGTDTETSDKLRGRISTKAIGNSLGTIDGFLSIVLAQIGVDDASVVGHNNSLRPEFGAVDIYIKGKSIKTQQDSYTALQILSDVILTKQPVIPGGVTLVQSSASGSLPQTTQWTFLKDISAYGGSIRAQDAIHWVTPLNATFGTVFVIYNYNGLVEDLQSMFQKTNKDVQNTDLLIKWASEIPINVSCRIRVLSGFDSTSVITTIKNELAVFFNASGIGQQVQQADVARTILNVQGVDDVVLPFDTFQSSDSTVLRDAFGNLNIPQYAYAVSGTITITVIP